MATKSSYEKDVPSNDSLEANLSSNSENETIPNIVELEKIKRWLQNQIIQNSAAISEATETSEAITDLEAIAERVKELGNTLKDVTYDNEIQQQILERTQLSDTLIKVLFPKQKERPEDDPYRDKVVKNIETQNEVSALVTKSHEELLQLRKEFLSIRKERLHVTVQNRELMDQLKQAKSSTDDSNQFSGDQQVQDCRNAVDEELNKAKIIKGIFQGFIVGSGIHWANDEDLKGLVIQLGQPIRRVLEEH